MTDFFNNLLTSMSSKFNETNPDVVAINLNDDKTLKWRGLHNNQFSKKRKDGKRSTDKNDDPSMVDESAESIDEQQSKDIGDGNDCGELDGDKDLSLDGAKSENNSTDKDKSNDTPLSTDQRVSRRLRRNNADESTTDTTRKTNLRPKRQSSSTGSLNENNRSVSPRVEKDEKPSAVSPATVTTNRNSIMTRQRGRANQTKTDDLNETNVVKAQNERKSGNDGDGEPSEMQSKPLKSLRRSERTNANQSGSDHKELNVSSESLTKAMDVDGEQGKIDKELVTRSRKRTSDDRKVQEAGNNDDKSAAANEVDEKTTMDIDTVNLAGEANECIQEAAEDEKIEVKTVEEANRDDHMINGNGIEIIQPPRKRGRRQAIAKSRSGLRLTAIGTRNAPSKKSPRFSTDESPFIYSIPKKDKLAAEAQPQQRLSRRIKPTPKILANEELRQGFEIQNNARLSLSSEHLDNELERSPKQKTPPGTPPSLPPVPVVFRCEPEPPQNGNRDKDRRKSNSPKQQTSTEAYREFIRPIRHCPEPDEFLRDIKLAKLKSKLLKGQSPELDKRLNFKQKKRLNKMKEKHFQKLGLQRVSKSSSGQESDDQITESDSEEFVPTQKIMDVGAPSVTLRIRGHRELGYDKTPPRSNQSPKEMNREHSRSGKLNASNALIDQLDHHSKEIIARNPEISLISSTKHKNNVDHSKSVAQRTIRLAGNHVEHLHHQITSEVTLSIRKEAEPTICLCTKSSKYYTRKTNETYCSAVDQIEDQKVGCDNEVEGELLNLLHPSVRVSYMLLCENHRKRLIAHNCCASCGVFCTQGPFLLCARNHFFHRECATKIILNTPFDPQNPEYVCPTLVLKCPHCGLDAPEQETIVMMRCGSVPIFTTSQKKLTKPAKMAAGAHSYRSLKTREEWGLVEIQRLLPESINNLMARTQNRFPFSRGIVYTNADVVSAITSDDMDRMAEIIATGYDITTPIREFYNGTCLHLTAHFGSLRMIYLIMNRVTSIDFFNLLDARMRTAIMCAIQGGKMDLLKVLIQCGADITIKGTEGMTALHLAVKLKIHEALEILLNSYRESVSLYNLESYLNARDEGGWTAIVWAADIGDAKMTSILLNSGADAKISDSENNTALHWATLSESAETINILLRNGCNVRAQNINGDTALHIACRSGNTRIALFLLAHGASLTITNNADETPYDCITDSNGQCAQTIQFNMQMRNATGLPEDNILCADISNGREMYPIQVVGRKKYRSATTSTHSDSDTEQSVPDFKYITKTILLQNSIQIDRRVSQMRICACLDNCTTQSCQCSEISVQNWYDAKGRLKSDFRYNDPAILFECNDVCGCNKLLCKNRVVQNGSKVPMQAFECDERIKGFGVRCIDRVTRGTFITQYIGEILTDNEADRRTDDGYFFELGSGFCIDANFYGNVSRFFNHSCEPNVIPIRVYCEHQDLRFPKIAFFATKDIESGEEITFDYGEKFWIAKQKIFTCHCGTKSCRFSEQTIAKTIEEYNQRTASN